MRGEGQARVRPVCEGKGEGKVGAAARTLAGNGITCRTLFAFHCSTCIRSQLRYCYKNDSLSKQHHILCLLLPAPRLPSRLLALLKMLLSSLSEDEDSSFRWVVGCSF